MPGILAALEPRHFAIGRSMNARSTKPRFPRSAPAACAALCAAAMVLTALPAAFATAASSHATQAQAAQIKAAWVRWLPGGVPLAGYATIANASDQPLVLTLASSAAFHDVSIHQTVQAGGTVRMLPLPRVTVASHTTLDFEARGIHLMLMQPNETLAPDAEVSITLHFADGSSLTVPFQVRKAAGA